MFFLNSSDSPTHRLTTLYPAIRSTYSSLGSGQSGDDKCLSQGFKRTIHRFHRRYIHGLPSRELQRKINQFSQEENSEEILRKIQVFTGGKSGSAKWI